MSNKNNLQIPLSLKKDVKGEEYLIGSTDLPASLNLRESTFLVFFPEEGSDKGVLMIRPRTLVPRATFEDPDRN